MAKPNHDKTVEEIAKKLLELMGVDVKLTVEEDKDNDAIMVDIEAQEEAGLLIGKGGSTINSIQVILGMIFRNKTGEWKRILVNVNEWRDKQESYLKRLAESAAQRAKETGSPQNLYNLNSSQRRIIHLYLSEDSELETESQGEGSSRYLLVRLKKK